MSQLKERVKISNTESETLNYSLSQIMSYNIL
jgi:hypothetical protein